jgi:hypothetical protein
VDALSVTQIPTLISIGVLDEADDPDDAESDVAGITSV